MSFFFFLEHWDRQTQISEDDRASSKDVQELLKMKQRFGTCLNIHDVIYSFGELPTTENLQHLWQS